MPSPNDLQAGVELTGSYDPGLVALSVFMAALGAYAGIGMADRARSSTTWLAAGAIALGAGIWTMHFIGMLAFRLPVPIRYDVGITLVSMLPAIFASIVTLRVISRQRVSQRELIVGGILMGLGIGTMHFTGMQAMRMDADLGHAPLPAALAVLIAAGLAYVALYVRFSAGTWSWLSPGRQKVLAASIMGGAVAAMHYTAMAAAEFHATVETVTGDPAGVPLDPGYLSVMVGGVALVIIILLVLLTHEDELAKRLTELRHTEEQLRQAQKMEMVGQLTGGIAHDFNNLLTVISGQLELLDESVDPELREDVRLASEAADRAANLTRRMLAFSRQQPLNPRRANVAELVRALWPILRRTVGETIELDLQVPAEPWTVEVDPAQLDNALINLAVNARDAMPDGGTLSIRIENIPASAAEPEDGGGDRVRLSVTDTGSGMDQATAERAFEPFFTTKGVGAGSGLGLSMVYGFVGQSGGHVRIDSEQGRGTTVTIDLPWAASDDGPVTAELTSTETLRGGNERILLVEDDALVRGFASRVLTDLGYHVIARDNGPDALAEHRSGDCFDLLLTDVVLPGGMNGQQLAAAIREHCPPTKVLFISGYTAGALMHDGRLDEDADLLPKPFARHEIAQRVRAALDATAYKA